MVKKVNKKTSSKRSTNQAARATRQTASVQEVKPTAPTASLLPKSATALGTASPCASMTSLEAVITPPSPNLEPLPALPPAINVVFRMYEPHARQVSLVGEFNHWSPDTLPMERQGDGHWQVILTLPPGRYEYKYVVDGQWLPDLNAREFLLNPFGTLNSVMEVCSSVPR